MHGATLREIEKKLPDPHEEVVDILGKIVFKVLINQFPREIFSEEVVFGNPSTYVHRTMTGVAHIQTVVPVDADGEFDLSFSGTKITMTTDGPPQSARPALIGMTIDQHNRIGGLSYENGDHQEMCRRIYQRAKLHGEQMVTVVLSTDMVRILDTLKRGDTGSWQNLFRDILGDGGA